MEGKIFIHITQCKHMGDQTRISMYSLNSALDGCQWLSPCSATLLPGTGPPLLSGQNAGRF